MNFRLTAVLFGLVFAVGVVLLVLSLRDDDKAADTDALAYELVSAGVKAEQIDAIEFERPDGSVLLIARSAADRDSWEIQKPIHVKADAARVLPVVSALLKAKPTAHAELRSDPAVHGLAPPSLKVTLKQGAERSSTINMGDVTLGDRGVVFVTTSHQPNRPMAVRRGDLDALFREPGSGTAGALAKWTSDYRAPAVFPSDPRTMGEDVASIRLELPNRKKELALSRAPGGWKFDSPAGWGAADSEGDPATAGTFSGVRRLLGALTSLSAASPSDFIDAPKDLKEYGLNPDNPDLVKVELKTRDGQSTTAYIGKIEGGPAAPKSALPPPGFGNKVYVRVEGRPGVIRAAASPELAGLVGVVNDPGPLRDRTLIAADANRVDGIDIVLAGQRPDQPTKLRRVGGEWKLYGGPGDPQKAFLQPVERLLDVLLARRNIKDFPAPNPANFAAISSTVFVWVDGFTPPADPAKGEPTRRGEPIKLEFGRKDGDTVYVRRTLPGGQVNEFALPAQVKTGVGADTADLLAAVTRTRLDLLDPALGTFGPDAVVKVSVTGQNTYTLEKDEKPDPYTKEPVWRYTAPEPKGRTADTRALEEMLRLLGTTQSVTRFVDEQPTPQKLAEYGLAPNPRLKVVVGLNTPADKERTYEFGGDTADPGFVYARVPGKPAVFTLPRLVFDRFANPDLRDRAIFRHVPVAQVNRVELKGWGDAGFVTELTFEKNKDGVWTLAKGPPGFAVDPAKVSAFVEMLAKSRVKTFERGNQEPKHGFGDPKQSFQTTLHWPGGNLHVNLAASPDGGMSYYGWTSALPPTDAIFTIDAALLKPYKEKPSGFAR